MWCKKSIYSVYMACKYFLPFCRLPFQLIDLFCSVEGFGLIQSVLLVYFCFCVRFKKIITKTYVKGLLSHIFFYEFYDFRYYSQVFDPLWIEATSFLNVSVIPKNGQNKRRRVSLIHYHHWKRVTSYILPKIHDCLSKTLK